MAVRITLWRKTLFNQRMLMGVVVLSSIKVGECYFGKTCIQQLCRPGCCRAQEALADLVHHEYLLFDRLLPPGRASHSG